jgi:hypothetical protein
VMILRHLLAILLLPFVAVVIIPRWLLRAWATSDTHWTSGTIAALVGHIAGIVVFLGGFGLFAWCVSLFARVGQGTLAPWDPGCTPSLRPFSVAAVDHLETGHGGSGQGHG